MAQWIFTLGEKNSMRQMATLGRRQAAAWRNIYPRVSMTLEKLSSTQDPIFVIPQFREVVGSSD